MARKPEAEEEQKKPVLPQPAEVQPRLYYANGDRTKIVPGDSPEAAFVFPANDPGPFEELLKAHQAKKHRGSDHASGR